MRVQCPSVFETAVLEWIAARSDEPALQEQVARAKVTEREYTVVGCYSTLEVPTDTPISTASYSSRGPLGGPNFESPIVKYGGGTLLWFDAGRASCLEIHVFGDYFPESHDELGDFRLLSWSS